MKITKAKQIIDEYVSEINYYQPIIDIDFGYDAETKVLQVRGKVLLKKFKKDILDLLSEELSPEIEIENSIDFLLKDTGDAAFICWKKINTDFINVYQNPKENKLSTQLTQKFPFVKLVYQANDYSLCQLYDQTIGWIENKYLEDTEQKNHFKYLLKAQADKTSKVAQQKKEQAFRFVNELLEAKFKYLYGGKSKEGYDCSGLIQSIFEEVFDLVLPKKSRDQYKKGFKVPFEETNSFDIVFAKTNKLFHIGIVIEVNDEKQIVHSCLKKDGITSDASEDFFKNYTLIGCKRLVEFI